MTDNNRNSNQNYLLTPANVALANTGNPAVSANVGSPTGPPVRGNPQMAQIIFQRKLMSDGVLNFDNKLLKPIYDDDCTKVYKNYDVDDKGCYVFVPAVLFKAKKIS